MAERSRRGVRRQISDTPDEVSEQSASESEQEWDPKRTDSNRRGNKIERLSSSPNATRSRRAATTGDESKQSIKLTMKVAPSKLREVMRVNEVDALHDTLGGGKVIDGPRSRRSAGGSRASARSAARPKYTEYGESDIEDEEDQDAEAEVADEEMNDFYEVGAEAEGGTDDEDVDMEDAPLPPSKRQVQSKQPKITLKPPPATSVKPFSKLKVTAKPPPSPLPFKSVEEQEMEDAEEEEDEEDEEDDEDDEKDSSELSEDEDATNLNDEGEGEELMEDEDEELDEEDDLDDDSGDETPASGMGTPDPARLTKRQRGQPEETGGLLALDMAPQQRKFFTDEEKAMKKDEHARKRKELTKRKINEEKTAALNRLLKPQASKARGAAPKPETLAAATAAAASNVHEIVESADPLYVRWTSDKDGLRLGVPEEWLGKKVGRVFGPAPVAGNGLLVQEVE